MLNVHPDILYLKKNEREPRPIQNDDLTFYLRTLYDVHSNVLTWFNSLTLQRSRAKSLNEIFVFVKTI